MKNFTGVLMLFLAVILVAFPCTLSAKEQPTFSLVDNNIVLYNSDVIFVSESSGVFYALAKKSSETMVLKSANWAKTWEKLPATGLPNDDYVVFKTSAPGNIALASHDKVFLSENGGNSFYSLAAPQNMESRGEEITSLAVSSTGQIAIGVWNPHDGENADDGIYLFAGNSWSSQKFYSDIIAVEFTQDEEILALSLAENGVQLSIGYPVEKKWNKEFSGWPIEISETGIKNSRMVSFENSKNKFVFIALNTKNGSSIYQVKFSKDWDDGSIQKLDLPDVSISSLDSLNCDDEYLAVGATIRDENNLEKSAIFLSESNDYTDWQEQIFYGEIGTNNCRAIIYNGKVFAGTSGKASSFCRLPDEGYLLASISLVDASGEVKKTFQSPRDDKLSFVVFGNNNVFRVEINDSGNIAKAQRVFYDPKGFDWADVRIDFSDTKTFILEEGETDFYLSDDGLIFSKKTVKVDMVSPMVISDQLWYAGEDGIVYQYPKKTMISGLGWIKYILSGPEGKILAVGGSKKNRTELISVVSENGFHVLPILPSAADWQVNYENRFVIAKYRDQIYRIKEKGNEWEKISPVPTPTVSPTPKTTPKATTTKAKTTTVAPKPKTTVRPAPTAPKTNIAPNIPSIPANFWDKVGEVAQRVVITIVIIIIGLPLIIIIVKFVMIPLIKKVVAWKRKKDKNN